MAIYHIMLLYSPGASGGKAYHRPARQRLMQEEDPADLSTCQEGYKMVDYDRQQTWYPAN